MVSFSLFMWFFIRMQTRKIWLPTLRVLELERSQVRKLRTQVPPWVPFLFFLLGSLGFLFLSAKPKSLLPQEASPTNQSLHLFLDMSPTSSAYVTLPQYVKSVEKVWKQVERRSKISASTTHSERILTPKDFSELEEWIYSLGFHRGGVDLGSAFKQQREKIGDVDGLIIFSDASTLAWQKFNWNFLAEDMGVFLADLKEEKTITDNVFFGEIRLFSAPFDPTLEWDLEIERAGESSPTRRGTVKLLYGGETLASVPWKLEQGISKNILRVSVHAKKISKLEAKEDFPLLWILETHEADALNLDNTFRTPLKGLRQDALLVGESFGERQIEDPFYQLTMALETFGFVPQRMDRWKSSLAENASPFVVLSVDESLPIQESCPLTYANRRVSANLRKSEDKFPILWLMPKIANGSLKTLCSCFQKLILSNAESSSCEQANSIQDFGEILNASGAKALGAKISSQNSAVGWYKEDTDQAMKVAVFTIPLKPSRVLGIDHATFPLMMKELLQWQGLLDESLFAKKKLEWPRISDLSRLSEWQEGNFESRIRESNLPLVASYLSHLSKAELPPMWTKDRMSFVDQDSSEREDYDPTFWLQFIFIAMLAIMLFEGLWNGRQRIQGKGIILTIFLCFFFFKAPMCFGDVSLAVLGSNYGRDLETILKELPLRTSIMLDEKVIYQDGNKKVLGEPWYWVRDRKFLLGKYGTMREDFQRWLKRGGFLIVQGMDLGFLTKLTKEAFSLESPDASWQPIPPDHELMRSFYLIDALPSCRGQIWNGFVFDGRLAILAIPFDFLQTLVDRSDQLGTCDQKLSSEHKVRLFINIAMAALATDYKRDQIHMREILKRLH